MKRRAVKAGESISISSLITSKNWFLLEANKMTKKSKENDDVSTVAV